MIHLSRESGVLVARASDDEGFSALRNPLHKLFLSGSLKAKRESEGQWNLSTEDLPAILTKLTNHLNRYDIEFELDEHCQESLRQVEEERRSFEEVMRRSASAKTGPEGMLTPLIDRLSPGFVRALTSAQLRALHHLVTIRNGANFSVPGAGKTSVVLAYYHLLLSEGEVDGLLVVGPISSFRPWEDEFALCFGRTARSLRFPGVPKKDRNDLYLTAGRYDLLLTSYHTAARDIDSLIHLLRQSRYLLVLDESHYVKRPVGGQLAEAALRLGPYAARRVVLTGTPMPNGLADIWSQITFLWPTQLPLGTSDAYLLRIKKSDDATLDAVRSDIDPLFYRISKRDLSLPKPRFKMVRCELRPAQARIYKGVAARFLALTREVPSDQDALAEWRKARAIRLLQIASNPALLAKAASEFTLPPLRIGDEGLRNIIDRYGEFEVPVKIDQVCGLVRKLSGKGRKVLIWSTFVHNLRMLSEHLSELRPAVIHGGVPYDASEREEVTREAEIDRFKRDENCRALIANPAACAESISLHAVCHDAIYLDRSFNCAHYLQSLDRIHRLGLKPDQETTYYLIVANETVDELVHSRLQEKMRRLKDLVEHDLPGAVPGYWGEDVEAEATVDFDLVEEHIRKVGVP